MLAEQPVFRNCASARLWCHDYTATALSHVPWHCCVCKNTSRLDVETGWAALAQACESWPIRVDSVFQEALKRHLDGALRQRVNRGAAEIESMRTMIWALIILILHYLWNASKNIHTYQSLAVQLIHFKPDLVHMVWANVHMWSSLIWICFSIHCFTAVAHWHTDSPVKTLLSLHRDGYLFHPVWPHSANFSGLRMGSGSKMLLQIVALKGIHHRYLIRIQGALLGLARALWNSCVFRAFSESKFYIYMTAWDKNLWNNPALNGL